MPELAEALSLSSLVAGSLEYAILIRHREERRQSASGRQEAETAAHEALTRVNRRDSRWQMRHWTADGTRFRIEAADPARIASGLATPPAAARLTHTSVVSKHTDSDISQAWANAQYHLPRGWKIDDLRHHTVRFMRTSVAPQALARRAEHPRADNAGDPWKATAVGPGGQRLTARGNDAFDALERLTWAVDRAAKRVWS